MEFWTATVKSVLIVPVGLQATTPTTVGAGGNLKGMKGQADEAKKEDKDTPSTLQTVGDNSAGMVI